jgi:NADH-quinone oxidoreductase subunit A
MQYSLPAGLNSYFVIFFILAFGLVLGFGVSGLSFLLGPKKPNTSKLEAYECGLPITSTAEHRLSIKFYLVAILFILFDIETIFMYLWAVAFDYLGWFGAAEIGLFVLTLAIGYIYVLKRGALGWDTIDANKGPMGVLSSYKEG